MAENKYIAVNYELFVEEEGQQPILVEKTSRDHCFDFVTGLGFTLPDFEEQVKDLAVGQRFDFVIPQDKAYGPYDEDRVKQLPKEIFRNGQGHFDADTIYPGNVIPMVNEEGMRFDGLVKEVTDQHVTVDFNHELAGMDLHFRGEIVESHEATNEEISHFINAMTGGGCHCGGDHCDGEHHHCNGEHHHCDGDHHCDGHHEGHDHEGCGCGCGHCH